MIHFGLKRVLKKLEIRLQLHQLAFDKIEELKKNLIEYPNLNQLWTDFEIAYKLATGKNLIQLDEILKRSEKNKDF
jgi:hypothetical protein